MYPVDLSKVTVVFDGDGFYEFIAADEASRFQRNNNLNTVEAIFASSKSVADRTFTFEENGIMFHVMVNI